MNIGRKRGRPAKTQPLMPKPLAEVIAETPVHDVYPQELVERPEQQFITDSYIAMELLESANDEPGYEEGPQEPEEVVYRWEVPGVDGYALRIEVEAMDAAQAELIALQKRDPDARELTALESNWIKTTPPQVIVPTSAITLEHQEALIENERLRQENLTYQLAKSLFEMYEIDIEDPMAWVDGIRASAQAKIDHADRVRAGKMRELVQNLQNIGRAVQDAVDSDPEFAPPKPIVPQEPDYSRLVVVADGPVTEMPSRYPRLASARFLDIPPNEPLTEEERQGFAIVFEQGDGLIEDYRIRKAGPSEDEPLKAISRRLKALVGLTDLQAEASAVAPVKTGPTGIPASIPVPSDNGDSEFVATLGDSGHSSGGWHVNR